ncbi:MAG: tetrahydromethanopterin S-methyltransferase subunit H [Chloroflexi bacterium]|nr:tetrahydromethanopterin S-methyltransferase subunit H [Chloroflexota bacterium]
MFRYELRQKVCDIGGIKVGGQPGDYPPLLLASMFQKGDVLLENRKERKFDRAKAKERILEMERLAQETGVPGMVAMVANTPDEMKTYIDFFVSVSDMPFAIDVWVQKTRLGVARYIAEQGLQDRLLYNSITPWDSDNEAQVAELKQLGIKHVIVQVFDMEDKLSTGRVKSLKKMLSLVEKGNFESVMVDTSAMNLPAISLSLAANYLIKKEFGLPVGFAPSNGSYMWRKTAKEKDRYMFPAIDAALHGICAIASDFLFYGPITGSSRVFPAVATASSMLATLAYEETSLLPKGNHPLNLLFPDVVAEFEKERGGK